MTTKPKKPTARDRVLAAQLTAHCVDMKGISSDAEYSYRIHISTRGWEHGDLLGHGRTELGAWANAAANLKDKP